MAAHQAEAVVVLAALEVVVLVPEAVARAQVARRQRMGPQARVAPMRPAPAGQ